MEKVEICEKLKEGLKNVKYLNSEFNLSFDLSKENENFEDLEKIKDTLKRYIERLKQNVEYNTQWEYPIGLYDDDGE